MLRQVKTWQLRFELYVYVHFELNAGSATIQTKTQTWRRQWVGKAFCLFNLTSVCVWARQRDRESNVKRKCGSAAAATAAVVLSITQHRQSQLTAMHVKHNYVYIQRLNSTLAPSQLLSCVPLSRMQNNKQSNSRWGNQNKRRDTQTQAPTPICDFVAKTEKEMCEVSALFDWWCLSLCHTVTPTHYAAFVEWFTHLSIWGCDWWCPSLILSHCYSRILSSILLSITRNRHLCLILKITSFNCLF